ncbi:calcium-binding protein [Bacillus cereus]|uniref:Calcium-binding protein n=1 Tax=Bacillus cereus TaxID=1396 RepID=A0A2B0MQL1_BACCE|nr:calcium-binding protein [Bacillus cereus]
MTFLSNISAVLFLVALILLILCIISFFKKNGKAMIYGRPGVICLLISLLGVATSNTKTDHPVFEFFANLCLILFCFFLILAILSIIKKTGMAKKQFLITGGLFIAFAVLVSIASPNTEKTTTNDKKVASEKVDKQDTEKEEELEKKEADEKARKLEEEQQTKKEKEEQKQQVEAQAQKQQEEQQRQAEAQAQKKQEEEKRQAEAQAQKQQEEQQRQAAEQAQKQQEEQQRQAVERASQKKSSVASSATSNYGGSNGQPFQNNPSDDKETNTSCQGQVKGNANSKKYHVPGGQYYDSTKDNIVWFCSEADAKAAGYVKSKR